MRLDIPARTFNFQLISCDYIALFPPASFAHVPIFYKFNNPAGGEPAVPFQNKLPGTTSSRHIVQVPRYCISPFEHDFYP